MEAAAFAHISSAVAHADRARATNGLQLCYFHEYHTKID
jgi:hypothetical protein